MQPTLPYTPALKCQSPLCGIIKTMMLDVWEPLLHRHSDSRLLLLFILVELSGSLTTSFVQMTFSC